MSNIIRVLGIESSCDDTGVAIVTGDKKILANVVISQNNEHAAYQGVVPEIAARAHIKNLEKTMNTALTQASVSLKEIDAIATTCGPGLIGGVLVGTMFGKALSSVLKKPFIAINHLEGHALSAMLTEQVDYPYLLLLASGGHCQFIIVKSLGNYEIIGQTLDDAVGEAFDKVAKMLNLGFPGGPIIEQKAYHGNKHKYLLPQPITNQLGCNMSFSGLKTAVRSVINNINKIDHEIINDISASFQYTVGEILSKKTLAAIEIYRQTYYNKAIVLSGGVAANQYLRDVIQKAVNPYGYKLITPPIKFCTDNAAMIAYAGVERLKMGLTNTLDFCPKARWNLEELKN